MLHRISLDGRASDDAGGGGLPDHGESRRHSDGSDGRGRRGRAGDRHPRRVRCPAWAVAGRRHRRAEGGRGRRPWTRLRPQHAGLRGVACRHRGQELPRGARHQGPRALLRMPGGRRRGRQGLHGARRPLRGRRRCHHVASGSHQPRRRCDEPGQYAHRFHLQGARFACGGGAASRPQRAGRGGADERRRQLHARAHAVGRPHPLRHARFRRRRAERGAGLREGALCDPRHRAAGHAGPHRARQESRQWRRHDDRDAGGA